MRLGIKGSMACSIPFTDERVGSR